MKKIKLKICFFAIFMSMFLILHNVACVSAASSIYFAGRYEKVYEHEDYNNYYILEMNQYSSPEGKIVGNFSLTASSTYRTNSEVYGKLKKVGKNKYVCKKGKITFKFKVYKNKVVVKQNRMTLSVPDDFSRTYKLKKRYYS